MSVEAYEEMTARFGLYSLIDEGLADIEAGRSKPFEEAMDEIEKELFR